MAKIFYPGMPNWLDALNTLAEGLLAPISTLFIDLNFSGNGLRIKGDLSNALHAKRLLAQTSAANSPSVFGVVPSGTATSGQFNAYNGANPDSAGVVQLKVDATRATVISISTGGAPPLPLSFDTLGAERARFGVNGEFLFGTTLSGGPISNRTNGFRIDPTTKAMSIRATSSHEFGVPGSSGSHIQFYTDNGTAFVGAGNIFSSGNTTSYASTSDYRLKSNVYRLTNCRESMRSLPPEGWTWPDGSPGEGWLAHKAQEFCPQAVIGVKDAMKEVTRYDAEGNPVVSLEPDYQSMDKTFFIPRMYGAQLEMDEALLEDRQMIGELREQLNMALARIDALEAMTA